MPPLLPVNSMNRKLLVSLIAVLLICICLVVAGIAALGLWFVPVQSRQSTPSASSPTVLTTPPAGDSHVSQATAEALRETEIPSRDLYQIVPRLRGDLTLLTPFPTPAMRSRTVGDREEFFVVENASTGRYRTVQATLQIVVPHAYYWVEDGMKVDMAALQRSADLFDKTIYPTNHKYFGSERSPGLDGDARIHILNTRFQDAAGYFSSVDLHPRSLFPFSNERNIIYLNAEAIKPGTDEYDADTAHEFQHLIHSYQAEQKAGWIDEGMSELAIKVNGFEIGGVLGTFARAPDTQLNTWAVEPQASFPHYAASYLFFNYVAQRFGPDMTRAIIDAPREGVNGIQAVLDQRVPGLSFDDLFADWAVANYLNDPSVGDGKYAYANESSFRVSNSPTLGQYPIERSARMRQYATNYYSLQPSAGDVTVYFTGTASTRLIAADAHSGQWVWYSNRADLANMRLTRAFDLTAVSKATLQFWTWYDIEKNFDYAYVVVSTDGGRTWDVLPGQTTTVENPNGSSFGPAFSGRSGARDDQAPAQWVPEQVDLTPYAGKQILLRFEYITDDAYNAPGWAIDDIAIPEIGYIDNAEGGLGGWLPEGFVRSGNVLPQRYIVQLVQRGGTTRVVRIPLDANNRGNIVLAGFGKGVSRADLVVTAHAPTTTEPTDYEFAIVPR